MTTDPIIRLMVINTAKKIVPPGFAINQTVLRAAYNIVRLDAIAKTVAWKRQHITIERT